MAKPSHVRREHQTQDERSEPVVIVTVRIPRSWKRRLERAGGATQILIPAIAAAIKSASVPSQVED